MMTHTEARIDGLLGKVFITTRKQFHLDCPKDLREYADYLEANSPDEIIFSAGEWEAVREKEKDNLELHRILGIA